MHPIHDADLLLLQAVTLASKRRPAALDEVIVALAMLQPRLPGDAKLLDAFSRLSVHGLIVSLNGGYTLSAEAQQLIATLPIKGEPAERAHRLKEKLAGYEASQAHEVSAPTADELTAVIVAWKASLPPPTKSEMFDERKQRQRELERANMTRPNRPPIKR